jgi:hypothetical protein
MTSPDSGVGRRATLSLFGGALLGLALTACATAEGEPTRRGGRGRRRDDVPFWFREEQRD